MPARLSFLGTLYQTYLGTRITSGFAKPAAGASCLAIAGSFQSEVILIATPPAVIFEIIQQIGDVSNKVLIDATNAVTKSPEPYKTVYHCLVAQTSAEVVKCFNSTGFENMINPVYNGEGIDMFMAGDSHTAKSVARQLAIDCGFSNCWDFGNSDKVELLEKFALSWINLAIMQGYGRNLAFKVLERKP